MFVTATPLDVLHYLLLTTMYLFTQSGTTPDLSDIGFTMSGYFTTNGTTWKNSYKNGKGL